MIPNKQISAGSKLLMAGAIFVTLGTSGQSSLAADLPADQQKSSPAAVEPERSMSLSASFDRAQAHNKEIIAAQYNVDVSKAAITTAGAILNPRFNLQYGFGPAFRIIIAGNPQQFGWQEEIQTAGKRSKQINLAKANYRSSQLQVAALLFDVHNRVRRAYAELAAAEAYQALIEQQRAVAEELYSVSEKRFDAGKSAKSEVFQSQLLVLQFDTQRNQAQLRLQQATAALALLLGEVPKSVETIDVEDNGLFKLNAVRTDLVPSPQIELPTLEILLPAAFLKRPDLQVAIQQKFADRRALTLAKAQVVPDAFVDSGFQFTTFRKFQPFGLTANNAAVPFQSGAYLNVSATLPVFYQQQGEIGQAKETWLQDQDQIEQLEMQIATDIVLAYERVQVARANIAKSQNELIPDAAKVARLARRSYQVGKTDISSAILAQQQYQQILSSYFDTIVTYQTAWADLEKAVGVSLKL